MKFDSQARGTIAVYISFLVVIIAAVAFAGRFVLFRPWTVRTHTCAVEYRDTVYLFGGRHRTGKPLFDILHADFSAETLKRAGDMPEALMSPAAASDGIYIYYAGGYAGKTYSDRVYRYDPGSETSTVFARLPYPAVYGAAVIGDGGLYYIGGWGGKAVRREILRVDLKNGDVTTAAMLPVPLQYTAGCIIDSSLYIIGGEDADGTVRSEVYALNLETGNINLAGNLPAPLCRSAAAAVNRGIYLAGGWSGGISDTIYYVRPGGRGKLSIIPAGRLPEPAADLAAAACDGNVYIFGGTDTRTKRQINIVRYDPASGEAGSVLLRSFAWW